MISGVLYALLAGLMWGLIFVGPLIVPDYPAVLQSMGRYLALGLIALPLAWLGRARLRQLSRQDWWTALALTLVGNVVYYICLASAIQRTGAPVSTMDSMAPPLTRISVPLSLPRARVRRRKCETDAMLGSASPRKPSVAIVARSSAR